MRILAVILLAAAFGAGCVIGLILLWCKSWEVTNKRENYISKTMKKLIAVALLACTISVAQAQISTNDNPFLSGPTTQILDFLSHGSNWMAVAYGTANDKFDKFGGGVALGYRASDFLVPTLRLDYYDGRVWMPSASIQLQAPMTLFGKITVIPFAISGIATPIAGKGSDNGTAVGIFGAGLAARVGAHWDIIGDAEKWTGFDGYQIRFGALYKF